MTEALTSAVSRIRAGGRVPTARASSSTVRHSSGAPRRVTVTASSRDTAGRAVRITAHTMPKTIGANAAQAVTTLMGGVWTPGSAAVHKAAARKAPQSSTMAATSA
ncbi:putative protein OS=Streptomyces antimycoticus OX=68175 GN=SSPO_055230 PE=4 SV=1 [Streptomyces antimycoticus]